MAAVNEVGSVIKIMETNDIAIEETCEDVFSHRQNPEEVTGREHSVQEKPYLDILCTPCL